MFMIRAIIRPDKAQDVLTQLYAAGFPAATKIDVFGRGRQQGISVGETRYDELPKQLLLVVVPKKDKDAVIQVIMKAAKTGDGHMGDGRIFVSPVEEAYTIRTGAPGL